jgi:hypothetical protein
MASPARFADPLRLANTFLTRLTTLGLASSGGRIDWRSLSRDVENRLKGSAAVSSVGHGALHGAGSMSSISRLLGARGLTHPNRYIAWVSWYFGDWASFVAGYEQTGAVLSQDITAVSATRPRAGESFTLIPDQQAVETGMSQPIEPECASLDAHAAAASALQGIRRKPKKLKYGLRDQLIADLRAGKDKVSVAHTFGVAIVTVTRVLLEEPGLAEAWHRVRFERARQKARKDWLRRLVGSRGLNAKVLRRLSPASYAWLYRNDRDWLKEVTQSSIEKSRRVNHAERRIEASDANLALRVQRTAATLAERTDNSTVTVNDLLYWLPELGNRISEFHKWPLTAQVLNKLFGKASPTHTSFCQPALNEFL